MRVAAEGGICFKCAPLRLLRPPPAFDNWRTYIFMSEILNRFSLSSAKWNTQVTVSVIVLWLAIVVCSISSIRAQPFSKVQQRFWMLVVVCFPIVGLLAYLPFSFRREDLPHALMLKNKHKGGRRRSSTATGGPQA